MLRVVLFISVLCSINLAAGNHCGSKEGYLNKLASKYLIPDYFPPKSSFLQRIFGHRSDLKSCLNRYGRAPIYVACVKHDRCYERRGASKNNCDLGLLQNWLKVCESKYRPSGSVLNRFSMENCMSLCRDFVVLMSKGQRFNKFGICPSCNAFEEAQKRHT